METPSEWAKRFNQPNSKQAATATASEEPAANSSASAFPNDPFPCPYCDQMLGPSCRVCVACKREINPADIDLTPAASIATPLITVRAQQEVVRYPWRVLVVVLCIGMVI